MIGAAVVFLPKREIALWVRRFLITVAFVVLIPSFVVITHGSATPGISTALPVCATAVLIYLGFESRLLSPLNWLEDISYSHYLVHWPLIVFFNSLYIHMSAKATVMLFVISVILAKIISVFLESPFRFETLKIARRKGLIAVAYGVTAVLLFAGFNGSFSNGDDSLLEMDNTHSALHYTNCHTEGPVPIIKGCYFADKASDKTVMLVGDSHASQYFPGLELAAKSAHYKLLNTTKSACPAILLGKTASNRDKSCYEWQVNIIDAIKRIRPNILVISNFTERTNDQFSIGITPKEFADLQTEFLLRVQKFAGKVVYIDDSPLPGLYGVKCLENNRKHLSRCDLPNTKTITSKKVEEQVRNLGVQIVDSRSFLCKGNICLAVIGRKNVYRDSTHISAHIYKVVAKGLAPIFS